MAALPRAGLTAEGIASQLGLTTNELTTEVAQILSGMYVPTLTPLIGVLTRNLRASMAARPYRSAGTATSGGVACSRFLCRNLESLRTLKRC